MNHIALVGKMHAGKTSIAEALVEHHGYTRIALADAVKDDTAMLLTWWKEHYAVRTPDRIDRDWIEANKAKVRSFLQWFGTDFVRDMVDSNWWIDRLIEKANEVDQPVVCDDCRFLNEAEALRRAGFIIVRIERPELERQESAGTQGIEGHSSETEQERIPSDLVVLNDGSASLAHIAECMMDWLHERERRAA